MAAMVVYVPARTPLRHQLRDDCLAWCQQHGHAITAVTGDPATALRMLAPGGRADMAVVARDAHGRHLPGAAVVRIPPQRRGLLAVPVMGWVVDRAREHPLVTAGIASGAAGLIALPLMLGQGQEQPPAEAPPVVAPPAQPPPGPTSGLPASLVSPAGRGGAPAMSPAPTVSIGPAEPSRPTPLPAPGRPTESTPSPSPPRPPPPPATSPPVTDIPSPAGPAVCLDVEVAGLDLEVCLG